MTILSDEHDKTKCSGILISISIALSNFYADRTI